MLLLYKNIKRRRIELNMTQEQLAGKLGYADKSMIAKIEAGRIDLSQSKIKDISEILDIDICELFGWEGNESKINKDERYILNEYPLCSPVIQKSPDT